MFTLPFTLKEYPEKIKLKDAIFSIGSCFSDNIGQKLCQHKFDVVSNPFGTIYNPYSIFKNIRLLMSDGLDPDNFIKLGDVYFHWDTHSVVSGTSLHRFKQLLEDRSQMAKQNLINAKWIIITLGTVYAYKYLPSDKIVANCHKVPQKNFKRVVLQGEEIIDDYFQTMELLRTINPSIKTILTVSPVRHVRDGLMENNYSKAVLIQVVHDILKRDPHSCYFPSYEIMIDELRDYRFYKPDMIHPNDQAIDYIWQKFVQSLMETDANRFITEWTKLRKAIDHRPFHPQSSAHQTFLQSTIQKLERLSNRVDVSEEIEQVKNQMI